MTDQEIAALAEAIAERLKSSSAPDLNWEAIPLPEVPDRKLRPQTSKLSRRAEAQIEVIAALRYSGSVASVIQTAVYMYLKACWPNHLNDIRALAAQESITPEEAFLRILSGRLKP